MHLSEKLKLSPKCSLSQMNRLKLCLFLQLSKADRSNPSLYAAGMDLAEAKASFSKSNKYNLSNR